VALRQGLATLSLAQKRQVARALLRQKFSAPRSFPVSYAQEQLWFMDKLQPGSPVYNIPLYIPFHGSFDLRALKLALDTLIRRHDMLRAHFDSVDEQVVQIIEPEVAVDLPFEDLSRLPPERRNAALGQLLNEEVQKPFDLAAGACARYKLIRVDPANYLLSATFHHIVTDAFSLGIFVHELNSAYKAYAGGQSLAPLPVLQLEYSDYAKWQRGYLRGLRLSKLVNYWTTQLAGAPPILSLPTDHPRPIDQTFNGTVVGFVFDQELSELLIAFSQRHRVTLFMLLLSCYYVLLYRYAGQEDIIVGAPVANRGHPELEAIIGLFVNTTILRIKLQDNRTFASLLQDVQATALDAFEHQSLPFGKLIDELNVERVPGYPPLYQVVFNFQNASLIESANPSAEGEAMVTERSPFVHSNTAKVDINLTVTQNGSGISGGIEYNSDLFDRETIERMIAHFKKIGETIVVDPAIQIIDIPLVGSNADVPDLDRIAARSEHAELIKSGEFNFGT
jgi:surfactin family lipopeptide synthetase A